MKNSWKKSLAIAAALAALCAGSAFAADNTAADKENVPPPPPGMFKEYKRPPLPKLTSEQKASLDTQRQKIFANWQNMTTQERRDAHKEFRKAVRAEQMKNMTSKEKEKFLKDEAKHKQERADFKAKWAKMTPAEREAFRTKHHEKMLKERTKGMTGEQKKAFLKRDAEMEKSRQAFRTKWEKMTPAEKEQWRKEHPRKEGQGPFKMHGYGNGKLPMGPGPVVPPDAPVEAPEAAASVKAE